MFRFLRVAVLLLVLVNVAVGAWLARVRSTSWEQPLRVAVFPVAADDSPDTAAYVAGLQRETFAPVADFMRREAADHGMGERPLVEVRLGPVIDRLPPQAPIGGNALRIMLWSLQLRFWAWRHAQVPGAAPDVRVITLFHDPQRVTRVPHSLGLQKGLIGVVYAFASASQADQNNVVIAHEFLHTLGATDKYDVNTKQPVHPDGYAEPAKVPLWPQARAEIMAGRIPVSATESVMPASLDVSVIGGATAREINWDR